MVRLGASSMFFHEYALEHVFSAIVASGLDTIEFWLETPSFWTTGRRLENLEVVIADYPSLSPITVHAPVLDLNPVSINPEVATVSVESACSAIRIAEHLGATVITIHPGRRTAKRPPSRADMDRFELYMEAVERVSGGLSVAVAVENMEQKINALLTTPESVRSVLDEYPRLSFTFDYAHALMSGHSFPDDFLSLCGDRLVNVHASDGSASSMHHPLGRTGGMNDLAGLLGRYGYDGPVIFEIEDLSFPEAPGYDEKIAILSREANYFREAWHKQVYLSFLNSRE
ncbi:hypothetical protein RJ53_03585 [Methanocalculus chunghsingensis]|uniref:Xylose isomerase-like TIM barrel domain-containing protein n=1 Tax=Methanocalculus chunghsingensis TaxID=156457 RepID=A0A8J8B3V5_9EURY|nr:sugar phosphate isomerase/epimerase [Methanocalculus chunghsingensis]MBR1368635.1 hypothetical protein [Methanocalculus chunghsingensis]